MMRNALDIMNMLHQKITSSSITIIIIIRVQIAMSARARHHRQTISMIYRVIIGRFENI